MNAYPVTSMVLKVETEALNLGHSGPLAFERGEAIKTIPLGQTKTWDRSKGENFSKGIPAQARVHGSNSKTTFAEDKLNVLQTPLRISPP